MNTVKEINRINERELQLGVKGSWHDEYKDSAYVFVGGLPFELTEGDLITIFSQWGEILDVNLVRDKETGKSRGFGFLMYEDQRSTVLAVDNMNGAQVVGRTLRVDHTKNYRQKGTRNEEGDYEEPEKASYNAAPPILSGSESDSSDDKDGSGVDVDEEDPMAAYIKAEKKALKGKAKERGEGEGKGKKRSHEGETKEEKRARKEAKRAKKARKEEKRSKRDRSEPRVRDRTTKSPSREESYRDSRDRSSYSSRRYDRDVYHDRERRPSR